MDVHIINFFKTLKTDLEQEVERGMHIGVGHCLLDEGAQASGDLNQDRLRFFIFQLLDEVSE